VSADAEAGPLRAVDRHRGVPANVGPDPAFDVLVAGERWLGGGRDRADVVGVDVVGVAVSRGTMWRCWARCRMLVMSSRARARPA